MIHRICVPRTNRPEAPSQVLIGDVLPQLEPLLAGRRPVLVTDRNLARFYPNLTEHYPTVVIDGLGEGHKTLDTVREVARQLQQREVDRHSYLVGVGGGIVTDITGFVASVYLRGLDFGFVASSLLAQVDASVGGKNGVNLDGFKNLIGVFNQPDFVLCDQGMLDTLPEREWQNGLAEVIKCGLIGDPNLFESLEGATLEALTGDPQRIHRAIVAAVELKARVVAADEREQGERKLLNLGHTLGHAIEKCSSDYQHGQAVAIGLCVAARLSKMLGMLPNREVEQIEELVDGLGLPHAVPADLSVEQLVEAIRSDKKRNADTVDFVLLESIGRAVVRPCSFGELTALLKRAL